MAPAWQAQLLRSLIERGEFARAHALWLRISGLRTAPAGIFNPAIRQAGRAAALQLDLRRRRFRLCRARPGRQPAGHLLWPRQCPVRKPDLAPRARAPMSSGCASCAPATARASSGLAWTVACSRRAERLSCSICRSATIEGCRAPDLRALHGPRRLFVADDPSDRDARANMRLRNRSRSTTCNWFGRHHDDEPPLARRSRALVPARLPVAWGKHARPRGRTWRSSSARSRSSPGPPCPRRGCSRACRGATWCACALR